jgi:hypothetical protein
LRANEIGAENRKVLRATFDNEKNVQSFIKILEVAR